MAENICWHDPCTAGFVRASRWGLHGTWASPGLCRSRDGRRAVAAHAERELDKYEGGCFKSFILNMMEVVTVRFASMAAP